MLKNETLVFNTF